MKLVADPFILYGEFFLERFDKSLADVAKRSNKIGKDPDFHMYENLLGTTFRLYIMRLTWRRPGYPFQLTPTIPVGILKQF